MAAAVITLPNCKAAKDEAKVTPPPIALFHRQAQQPAPPPSWSPAQALTRSMQAMDQAQALTPSMQGHETAEDGRRLAVLQLLLRGLVVQRLRVGRALLGVPRAHEEVAVAAEARVLEHLEALRVQERPQPLLVPRAGLLVAAQEAEGVLGLHQLAQGTHFLHEGAQAPAVVVRGHRQQLKVEGLRRSELRGLHAGHTHLGWVAGQADGVPHAPWMGCGKADGALHGAPGAAGVVGDCDAGGAPVWARLQGEQNYALRAMHNVAQAREGVVNVLRAAVVNPDVSDLLHFFQYELQDPEFGLKPIIHFSRSI
eukprot:CAMPEP_0194706274 /NCGR_PEP_ID=MMETSP0295-20121207/29464_1 /TAXON_ID=39354 /ORGANISM="Heterosigma akashiwo, Strain CCMP2393" /LENGTH=310 /DNA_ID=CAMNT_0039602185 /DNA_START=126 /DNA_END=1061 /DNA_ORIENTATION=-